MRALFNLEDSAGNLLVETPDAGLAFLPGSASGAIMVAGTAGGPLLLEAAVPVRWEALDAAAGTACVIALRSAPLPDGWLSLGESPAARFRLRPMHGPARESLLAALPAEMSFDAQGLLLLFAQGGEHLLPVVSALLPLLGVADVRQSWRESPGAAKAPFHAAVRAHTQAASQPFGAYTSDLLAAEIAQFGWSIGGKSYGRPLVMEPGHGQLTIGRYCSMASPTIILANHAMRNVTSYPFVALWQEWPGTRPGMQDHVARDVVIGNDVWLGVQSIILPGSEIGDGAVIGAGCVVSGKIPPYSVCVGNPGRVRFNRFSDSKIARLLRLRWWDWPDATVDRYLPYLLSPDVAAFLDAAEAEFGSAALT
jgi:acetyltransferase-like isoleucine patch superfamily enzyme